MALPIRDGNQTLTTLSTIIVNSAHVPAHSVVSLGSQAITDIATAVSGVELGPNTISALENIAVTFGVGASVTIGNVVSVTGGLTDAELRASSVTIGGSVQVSNFPATQSVTFSSPTITGSVSVLNLPATQAVTFTQAPVTFGNIAGSVTAVISGTPSVTFTQASVTFTQASVTFGQAVVSASNIGDLLSSVATDDTLDTTTKFIKIGGHQSGSNQISHIVHVSNGGAMSVDASGSSVTFTQASVTFSSITGSVSVLNFPATQTTTFSAITGSVSVLNLPATQTVTFTQASVTFGTPVVTGSVSVLNFPSTQTIAGTVTANGLALGQEIANVFPLGIGQIGGGGVRAVADLAGYYVPVAVREGTVTANSNFAGTSGTTLPSNIAILGAEEDGGGNAKTLQADGNGFLKVSLQDSGVSIDGKIIASDGISDVNITATTDGSKNRLDVSASGTVTANGGNFASSTTGVPSHAIQIGFNETLYGYGFLAVNNDGNELPVRNSGAIEVGSLPAISGTVTVGSLPDGVSFGQQLAEGYDNYGGAPVQIVSSSITQSISGTVTANVPMVSNQPTGQGQAIPVILITDEGKSVFDVNQSLPVSGAFYQATQPVSIASLPASTVTVSSLPSVTISSLPAISGTVTANTNVVSIPLSAFPDTWISGGDTLKVDLNTIDTFSPATWLQSGGGNVPISGTVTVGNATTSSAVFAKICGEIAGAGPNEAKEIITDSQGMLYARLAPSSSLVSDPVVYDPTGGGAFINIKEYSGTTVTTSNFTSTTASTTIASSNSSRKGLTIFNEGAGNLHICAGATATTLAYQVRLSAGDYWECPSWQTSLTHSAQFATSGTARVVEIV